MSGLFESLHSAARSLTAARMGVDVAGQNIANINTPGYSRRTLLLAEEPSTDLLTAGRGVNVLGIQAHRDRFVESRIWREKQGSAFDDAVVGSLMDLDGATGPQGAGIDTHLTSFFDAFVTLADDPTSASARDAVVAQGTSLATTFHDMAERLRATRASADAQIGGAVQQVNVLSARVAALNEQITGNGPDVEALVDQRNEAVSALSALVGVGVITRNDGLIDLTVGQGRPLVVGSTAYVLDAAAAAPGGFLTISDNGSNITTELTAGSIGGYLHARDAVIPGYQSRLDQIAFDVAAAVNTAHQAGFDANGTAGGPFFAPLGTAAGAATNLQVSTAVLANSGLVAASATGAVGDNQAARAIAALRSAPVTGGGTTTAADAWGYLVYSVGADLAGALTSSQTHGDVLMQLDKLRDATSGVSLDEEAANLMRFQRAFEANARYFTTIGDTLDALMAMVQ